MRGLVQVFAELGEQVRRTTASWVILGAVFEGRPYRVVTGHDGVTRVRVR